MTKVNRPILLLGALVGCKAEPQEAPGVEPEPAIGVPGLTCDVPSTAAFPRALTSDDADASFVGEDPEDQAGARVAAVGDVDGDGIGDLAIAAPHSDDGAPNGGEVYLVRGRASGWSLGESLSDHPSVVGDLESMELSHVVGLGDTNGDGFADVALSPGYSEGNPAGEPVAVLGRAEGWMGSLSASEVDAVSVNRSTAGSPNTTRSGIGDIDGDGLDDWMISGPALNHGEVHVISGSRVSGTLTVPDDGVVWVHGEVGLTDFRPLGDLDGDGILELGARIRPGAEGPVSALEYVVSLAGPPPHGATLEEVASIALVGSDGEPLEIGGLVGDLDGDGRPELAAVKTSGASTGRYLYRGRTEWPRTLTEQDADVVMAPGLAGEQVFAIGDINGDGRDDLALLGPCSDVDEVTDLYLVFGRAQLPATIGLSDADVHIAPGEGLEWIQRVHAGDFDGDGLSDLLLANPHDWYRGSAGAMHLFAGRREWAKDLSTDHAELRISGTRTGEKMGNWLTVADVDGDGADDIVTASPVHPVGSEAGEVFVFFAPLR